MIRTGSNAELSDNWIPILFLAPYSATKLCQNTIFFVNIATVLFIVQCKSFSVCGHLLIFKHLINKDFIIIWRACKYAFPLKSNTMCVFYSFAYICRIHVGEIKETYNKSVLAKKKVYLRYILLYLMALLCFTNNDN